MTYPPSTPGPEEPQPPAAGFDPSQSYVVYQAAPPTGGYAQPPAGGYGLPPAGGYGVPVAIQAGYDPLISPDYSGWWQRSLAIFKQAWKMLLALQGIGFVLQLLVGIPAAVVFFLFIYQAFEPLEDNPSAEPNFGALWGIAGLALVFVLLSTVITGMITVAGNHIVVSIAAGQRPRLGAAFGLAARRCLPLLGWQVLASLCLLVGFCLCVLPGIYLYAVFLVLPVVVTFERGSGGIARCFQLFHRDFGSAIARIATVIGITVGVGFIGYVVNQIIQTGIAAGAQTSLDPDRVGGLSPAALPAALITALVLGSVASALISAGGKIFTDVLIVTAYADMRARIEPLSTAALAAEVGLAPAAGSEWMAPAPQQPPAY